MKYLIVLLLPAIVSASPTIYRPVANQKAPIKFTLPYTLGTHDGETNTIHGITNISTGEFRVPVSSIKNGSDARDCHMQEALTLDYSKSDYPADHVCDDDKLPTEGKNVAVYPDIILKITSTTASGDSLNVEGSWTIHGVLRPAKFTLKKITEGTNLRLKGEIPFLLSDYNVTVKTANILFVKISVDDQVKVTLDLLLEPQAL